MRTSELPRVWMINWEGTQDVQLTFGEKSASTPRWSPDGKYLAFLSARAPDDKTQVWVLDRRGGEARQLTNVKGDIDSYDWSPDSKRLVMSMTASDEDKAAPGAKPKAPKPIVLDRYHFKRDVEGYLTDAIVRTTLFVRHRKQETGGADRRERF